MVCIPEMYWRPQWEKAVEELRPEAIANGQDPSIAMSLRKPFEGDLLPASTDHPYVGNAFGWANVLVTAGDITSKPLSWLARQVRHAINEQGMRAQHEAYYGMVRTSGTGLPIIVFGDGGIAQWAKFEEQLKDFDISGPV